MVPLVFRCGNGVVARRALSTEENGRGISGFFHIEFHSLNDTAVADLIRQRPQEYARILAETLGSIPGANLIVPKRQQR